MASLLVDCWEGAALRSRLRRDPAPLGAMLDFYFRSAGIDPPCACRLPVKARSPSHVGSGTLAHTVVLRAESVRAVPRMIEPGVSGAPFAVALT